MARTIQRSTYAICPIDDCPVSFEAEIDGDYLCPTCKMEMLTACAQCGTSIHAADQVTCSQCEGSLKE